MKDQNKGYSLADGSWSSEYKVGDKFVYRDGTSGWDDPMFPLESSLSLEEDDGSLCPYFKSEHGDYAYEDWGILVPLKAKQNISNPNKDWKIYHLRRDKHVSKGQTEITLLIKDMGKRIAYKFAVCSPNDNFCRKEGVRVASEKPETVIAKLSDVILTDVLTHLKYNPSISEQTRDTIWYFI